MNIDIIIAIIAFLVIMAINISLYYKKISTLSKMFFVLFVAMSLWATIGIAARAYMTDTADFEIKNNSIIIDGKPVLLKETGIEIPDSNDRKFKIRRTKCPGQVIGIKFSKNIFYSLIR